MIKKLKLALVNLTSSSTFTVSKIGETMQTIKDLCECFDGFSKDSRILIHSDNGDTVMYKWKDACNGCYVVKRFLVVNIINNIIVLVICI